MLPQEEQNFQLSSSNFQHQNHCENEQHTNTQENQNKKTFLLKEPQ